jgi:hypothetical protein
MKQEKQYFSASEETVVKYSRIFVCTENLLAKKNVIEERD